MGGRPQDARLWPAVAPQRHASEVGQAAEEDFDEEPEPDLSPEEPLPWSDDFFSAEPLSEVEDSLLVELEESLPEPLAEEALCRLSVL